MTAASRSKIVSSDQDLLVLVDSNDKELGTLDKVSCHAGQGVLHRAISVFLFNVEGQVLLQQRHPTKALWGGRWSNACCSHPRLHESASDAASRRVSEELGLTVDLRFCFKFEYQANWDDTHAEHELCSVFIGKTTQDPMVNDLEIQDWRWIDWDQLSEWVAEDCSKLTPWLKIEWRRLNQNAIWLEGMKNA